jgi:hypothetical protein
MFYLSLGQISNEITLLRAQMLISQNMRGHPLHDVASGAFALLNARFLAGKLFEGWEWCNGARAQLAKYKRDKEARKAWKKIAAYFNAKDTIIQRIRHEVAFHSDRELAIQAYENFEADEHLVEYLTPHIGASLYGTANSLTTLMMVALTGEPDREIALGRILDEINDVSSWFIDYIQAVQMAFVLEHIKPDWITFQDGCIKLADAPAASECRIGLFCTPPTQEEIAALSSVGTAPGFLSAKP